MEIESGRIEGLRVRVFEDDDPESLDGQGDFLPLVVSVPKRGGSPEVEAQAQYEGDFDITRLAWAVEEFSIGNVDEDKVIAYMERDHGVAVRLVQTLPNGDTWWVVATPEWITRIVGSPDRVDEALKRDAAFVLDWCEGNVYRYQLEYEGEWTHNATGAKRTEWQPLEGDGDYTSGNLVGYEYAVEEARRALAEAELEEPVAFPQQRPHMIMPRAEGLWKAVAEPALRAEPAEYFHIRRVEDAGASGWAVNLRIGWGIDTTTEQRFDEDMAWAALVACATGALPIDEGIALECRDLVMADWRVWRGHVTPLSKRAAETVVQVALIGSAPYPDVQ